MAPTFSSLVAIFPTGARKSKQNQGRKLMKTNEPNNKREESTYSLIARSEETKRAAVEVVVYSVIVLSMLAAIWEFGQELFWFQS
jgi:hypothetical protein